MFYLIKMNRSDIEILCLLLISSGLIYGISLYLVSITKDVKSDFDWLIRLLLNIVTYSTVFVPGLLVYKYVQYTEYLEDKLVQYRFNIVTNLTRKCLGHPADIDDECRPEKKPSETSIISRLTLHRNLLLLLCAGGLQLFYLTWGVLQEKIMTRSYIDSQGNPRQFTDSQFLVFFNRILALFLAGIYLLVTQQTSHKMPYYKYIYCSFSNIMSSWCQYEALKFISFPTQVLAKASKVIPVMIMGRFVSGQKYSQHEYLTMVSMSVGIMIFMLESPESAKSNKVTTFSGALLLLLYIVLDSFTSNWQDALFRKYQMTSVQMMFGVNLFSCVFTLTSLMQQSQLMPALTFMYEVHNFFTDCIMLSICSAAGQLLIFFTISSFGPVVFALIMTIRQFLAVLLSYLLYKHYLSYTAIFGVAIVFGSIFLRQYCKQKRQSPNVAKV